MERFLQRHASRILGSLSGFDRVLFRGVLRSISYVQGLDYFMESERVGFKDFAPFVEKFSTGIKVRAERIARRAGRPFVYVASGQASKEAQVRKLLEENPVKEGLVCVLSCVEPCQTFTVRRDRESRQLRLVAHASKCLHLYFYFVDQDFGLMHIRLQTWLPLTLQVCVNGHEWLARQMQRAGIEYEQEGQLFYAHCRPDAGASVDGSAGGVALGADPQPLGTRRESLVGGGGASAPAELLLDGTTRRIRHRRDVW
jgi:hypothetical protein